MRITHKYSIRTIEAAPCDFQEIWGENHLALQDLESKQYDTIYPGRYHVGFVMGQWRLLGVSYPSGGLIRLATITEDDVLALGLKGKKLLFIQKLGQA